MDVCKHKRTEVRRRINSNGVQVCLRQCLDCYANMGNVSKANYEWELLNWFDGDAKREHEKKARQEWRESRQESRQAYTDDYHAYLRSDDWFRIKRKVLDRDGHLCQGCLSKQADEVHHKTYEHVKKEFAFELISLCRECHSRLHGKPYDNGLDAILY